MHAARLEAPVHRQLFRPTEAHPAPERSAYRAQERTPSRQRRQRRYPARGPRGTRTPDILGVNEALYQLSYKSIGCPALAVRRILVACDCLFLGRSSLCPVPSAGLALARLTRIRHPGPISAYTRRDSIVSQLFRI